MPALFPFNFFQGLPPTGYSSTGIYGDVWYRFIGESNGNFPSNVTILRAAEFQEPENLSVEFSAETPPIVIDSSNLSLSFDGQFFQPLPPEYVGTSFSWSMQTSSGIKDSESLSVVWSGVFQGDLIDSPSFGFLFSCPLTGVLNDKPVLGLYFSGSLTGVLRDTPSLSTSFSALFNTFSGDDSNILVTIVSGTLYRDFTERLVTIGDEDIADIYCEIASCKLYQVV